MQLRPDRPVSDGFDDNGDWFQLGRSEGRRFGSPKSALRSIVAYERQRLDNLSTELSGEIERVTDDENEIAERAEQLDEEYRDGREHLLRTRRDREKATSDYSLVKGVFYLIMAVLLVFADLAIIGKVSAIFLGYTWRSQSGVKFSDIFFDPVGVFVEFPDLLWLTLSILLMGFFMKVWRDSWFAYDKEEGRWRWPGKFDFLIFTVLLLLALSSLVAMAGTRLAVSLGDSNGWYAKFVMFILGLSLPLVSAGFFMKGYDALAKRWELWRLSWVEKRAFKRKEAELVKLGALRKQRADMERRLLNIADSGYRECSVIQARERYRRGFGEGLGETLGTEGGLVPRLRGLVIQRNLLKELDETHGETRH